MSRLAGSYRCKNHDTRYSYEATWTETGGTAHWTARIFDDGRLASASGRVKFTDSAGAAVQKCVETYIEATGCREARLGSCARKPTAGQADAMAGD